MGLRLHQADAKSVYDALFRPPAQRPAPDDDDAPDLATRSGCWAHARRRFLEAAITKNPIARAAIQIFFEALNQRDLIPTQRSRPASAPLRPCRFPSLIDAQL